VACSAAAGSATSSPKKSTLAAMPPIAEAGNDSEHVLDGLAGDVAAGHGVGTPLQGQGSTHLLFEALAGDELEQQPPP
jgi:hypothetical protein